MENVTGITSESDSRSTTPSEDISIPSTVIALSPNYDGEAPANSTFRFTKQRLTKRKLINCRTCNFSTHSKKEYWTHAEIHMTGRILICPICPFVTQYKHHLKYRISKHIGAKPVQCEFCDYSCITKSMLTSHMKSHSNVREYRCRDRGFETKYQHKLTAHMKKHSREQTIPKLNEEVTVTATSPTSETPELRQKIQFCMWMAQWETLNFHLMKGQPEQEEPLDLSVPKNQQ